MITCLVGNSVVNCFDRKYDKHKLKEWSDKRLLKCPDCGNAYEYCHGEIVLPYFRHKDKSKLCDGIYSEPETQEHIQGKVKLYELLKKQNGVENLKLEAYIPETKQRPDIYFEYYGKRYVIEYQCTPIASEYLKRKELYRLANINDIWILGCDKYDLYIDESDNGSSVSHSRFYKHIEDGVDLYFKPALDKFIFKKRLFNLQLPYSQHVYTREYFVADYSDVYFDYKCGTLGIDNHTISKYIQEDEKLYNEEVLKIDQAEVFKINKLNNTYDFITEVFAKAINIYNPELRGHYTLQHIKGRKDCIYTLKLMHMMFNKEYIDKIKDTNTLFGGLVFFVKNNSIDFCRFMYGDFTRHCNGESNKKRTEYNCLKSHSLDTLDFDTTYNFIKDCIENYKYCFIDKSKGGSLDEK